MTHGVGDNACVHMANPEVGLEGAGDPKAEGPAMGGQEAAIPFCEPTEWPLCAQQKGFSAKSEGEEAASPPTPA